MPAQGSIRNVADTAIWVAVFRARETEKEHPLFRDPYARRLAGDRGEQIAREMRRHNHQWAYTVRTYLFDTFVRQCVADGVDTVINLAAGLDARPYRMDLPPSLRWIEVDLPEMIEYKESILAGETPKCRLERVAMDLADRPARKELFDRIAADSKQAMIVSEGLLIYLGEDGARGLAEDLCAERPFRWWAIDIASPALLRMMRREVGSRLDDAGASLKFAPPEGPAFFETCGWRVVDPRSTAATAVKVTQVPFWVRMMMKIFREKLPPGEKRMWAGVVLLENAR